MEPDLENKFFKLFALMEKTKDSKNKEILRKKVCELARIVGEKAVNKKNTEA